ANPGSIDLPAPKGFTDLPAPKRPTTPAIAPIASPPSRPIELASPDEEEPDLLAPIGVARREVSGPPPTPSAEQIDLPAPKFRPHSTSVRLDEPDVDDLSPTASVTAPTG